MTTDGEHLGQLDNLHKGGDGHPDWFAPAGLAVSPVSSQLTIWGKLKRSASILR